MNHENAKRRKAEELEIIRKADCTFIVSQAEIALLHREGPQGFVQWFPFVRESPGGKRTFESRRNIAFIGGYLFEPNVDAITYFVTAIWPEIKDRLPNVELLIVGSNMPEGVRRLAGDRVRAVGYVEDVRQFLESCRLTVAPLRYGAGIKGKVATSLSHGVPVVASSIAIEGMGCEHGVHALVADSVEEWVDAVTIA